MTHIQKLFIQNLRYYRTKAGFSQLSFSEKINLSPNYLNAIENGKNFPSLEVMQKIVDTLDLLPYQLFLEFPDSSSSIVYGKEENKTAAEIVQVAVDLKQKFTNQIDSIIEMYSKS